MDENRKFRPTFTLSEQLAISDRHSCSSSDNKNRQLRRTLTLSEELAADDGDDDESRESRRTFTLSEQLAVSDHHSSSSSDDENSSLKDNNNTNTGTPKSTSYHSEKDEKKDSKSRTLLDIIKDDDSEWNGTVVSSTTATNTVSNNSARLNWQSLKDRLRLCRAGSVAFMAAISNPTPISDPELVINPRPQQPAFIRSFSHTVSVRNLHGNRDVDSSDKEEDDEEEEENAGGVSLMALLGQSDDQWDDDEGKENAKGIVGEADDEDGEEGGEIETACCVCMVRQKGAAFIPCGHTFCRLCSRELWVSRGNCPLCNAHILEILDIY